MRNRGVKSPPIFAKNGRSEAAITYFKLARDDMIQFQVSIELSSVQAFITHKGHCAKINRNHDGNYPLISRLYQEV